MDLITIERWFIEGVIVIIGGIIVVYGLCWLFDQCNKD